MEVVLSLLFILLTAILFILRQNKERRKSRGIIVKVEKPEAIERRELDINQEQIEEKIEEKIEENGHHR